MEDHTFKHGNNGQSLQVPLKGVFLLKQKQQVRHGKCQRSLNLVLQKNSKTMTQQQHAPSINAPLHLERRHDHSRTASTARLMFRNILSPAIVLL